jgi:predicted RNase H-like HicB family nuclease
VTERGLGMQRTFSVRVEWDPESEWYVGEVPELPGCYTQAPDIDSLLVNIKEAIMVYLETVEDTEPSSRYIGTLEVTVPV